jgi:hypothetical protein
MKSTLLATVALGALALPLTALASPPDSGMVQANIGFGWVDDNINVGPGDPFDDTFNYGGRTQWMFPLSKPITVQGDLFIDQMNSVLDSNFWPKTDSTLYGATAHLIHPMDSGRLGVAGSLFNVDVFSPAFGSGQKGVDYALVALEGQLFTPNWTLMAQGGWFSDINGCTGVPGCMQDGYFLRGGATYFLSKNTDIAFDGSVYFADDEFTGTVEGETARIEAEHKFDNSSFSAFVGVSYDREQVDTFFASSEEDRVTLDLGFRAYIDQMTLFDFSQDGPSLNTPTFHHGIAAEGILDITALP